MRAASLVATGRPGNLQIRLVDPAAKGERVGLGACTGNSGGPVFRDEAGRFLIIGVVSWSTGPNNSEGCGGLTGVTPLSLYRNWIVDTARKLGSPLPRDNARLRSQNRADRLFAGIGGFSMRHGFAPAATARLRLLLAIIALVTVAPDDASAVVKGTSSSLDRHTVRVIRGGIRCSGVAIARQLVATRAIAAAAVVIAGGVHIGLAGRGTSAILDDGRRVSVVGDAAILRLAKPLPASVTPATVGDGDGDTYVIAAMAPPTNAIAALTGNCAKRG